MSEQSSLQEGAAMREGARAHGYRTQSEATTRWYRSITLAIFASVVCGAYPARAFTWTADTRVSAVVVDYMPNAVQFQLFGGSGQCPSGTWLSYRGDTPTGGVGAENAPVRVKTAYVTLTAALIANRNVRVFGKDNCEIEFIYLLGF